MLCSLQGNMQKIFLGLCGRKWETLKKRVEQHFKDVAQEVQYNKNLDTFSAHFVQNFDKKWPHNSVVK